MIERRESGPAFMDKTGEEFWTGKADFDAAKVRHAAKFDECDLEEAFAEISREVLAMVKRGSAESIGARIIAAYRDRIEDLATWSTAE